MSISTPVFKSYYTLSKVLNNLVSEELNNTRLNLIIGIEAIRAKHRAFSRFEIITKYCSDMHLNNNNINEHVFKLIRFEYLHKDLTLNFKGIRLIVSIKRLYKIEADRG